MIQFQLLTFQELSVDQLYDVLKVRSEIFVVEQNCVYLDPDGKDKETLHLLGTVDNKIAAYLRIFPPTPTQNYIVFGRVVTASFARKSGYGKQLLKAFMDYCDKEYPGVLIKCSAQYYLKKFYEGFGLVAYGDIYDEDGIPHIGMQKNAV